MPGDRRDLRVARGHDPRIYATLDVRTADWPLGNALYKGTGSLGPVVVEVIALGVWARLNLVKPRPAPSSA